MDILHLEQEIRKNYSASSLQDLHRIYFIDILQRHPQIFRDWGLSPKEFESVYVRKQTLSRLFAIILFEQTLLKTLINQFPADVARSLRVVAWEGKKTIKQLEDEIDAEIMEVKSDINGAEFFAIPPPYCLFLRFNDPLTYGTNKKATFLDLTPTARKAFKSHVSPPAGYELDSISAPTAEFLFEDNEAILDKLPLFVSLLNNGEIQRNRRGDLTQKTMRRIQEITKLVEFYPDHADSRIRSLRARLVFHFLRVASFAQNGEDSLDYLRKIFERFIAADGIPNLRLLDHLTGWQFTKTADPRSPHKSLFFLLKKLPVDEWINVAQLIRHAALHGTALNPVDVEQAERYLRLPSDWRGWGNDQESVDAEMFAEAVTVPLIKAILFSFAAFGLLDVAYEYPANKERHFKDKPYLTIYDGLKLIRLTGLGAYISGKTDDYSRKYQPEDETKLLADDKQLILMMTVANRRIEYELEQIASKIGDLRYRVDYISFLKKRRTKEDVNNKINWLKSLLENDIPENWKVFFDELSERVDVFEPKPDMKVYRISAKNAKLINFLMTDEIANRYIKKAENHHIVVSDKDLAIVRRRAKQHGFII